MIKTISVSLLLFVLTYSPLFAQIDVKTAPILWFTNTVALGIEYGIKPNLGLEVEYQRSQNNRIIGITSISGVLNGGFVALKHYFNKNEEKPLSQFYTGGYAYYMAGESQLNSKITSHTIYSFGVTTGYKGLLVKKHLILEGAVNLGKRSIYENNELAKPSTPVAEFFYEWDISTRLLIGYRF
jgi:Protein of unknown function (DUF3575)